MDYRLSVRMGVLVLFLGMLLWPVTALAEEVHIVQPGETLTQIAQQHNTSVAALRSLNNLNNVDFVWAGQRLVLPDNAEVTDAPSESSVELVNTVLYETQPGDTLFSIAARYRTSLAWLAEQNKLNVGQRLVPGRELVVPAPAGGTLTTGETLQPSWIEAARQSALTTVSVQTTTGFCTSDFNLWPFLAKALLLLVMFVGGCAGSTGGGIKVIRVLIAFKVMVAELERVFRPNVVRPLKVGKATIGPELRLATLAYVFGLILLFGAGTGLLKLFEPNGTIDMTTAASASVATLCNIGPGLAKVGAVENYAWFTAPSKCVMIILMALGRLEVFAILVLFSPRFWRTT